MFDMSSDYAVIIAARMTSARLPGKAMVSYCADGTPNLQQIIQRWQSSMRNPTVIVATGDSHEDAPIEALCRRLSVPCFPAPNELVHQRNVTQQIDMALKIYAPNAKFVARGTADNPLVDVGLADWRYDLLQMSAADGIEYGSYHPQITYAGTTDVYNRSAWDRIASESSGSQMEHPGALIWENMDKFSLIHLPPPRREYLVPIRTELDTPEDLAMFKALFSAWPHYGTGAVMPTLWALDYLIRHPEVSALNSKVSLKSMSHPVWGDQIRGWMCERCGSRIGSIVQGDLAAHCPNCGKRRKFYATKPARHH